MKKISIFIIIFLSFLLLNIQTVKSDADNIYLNFFYTKNCDSCHNAEPIIDDIEDDYPNVTITRYMVLVDENLDNYSMFHNFYRFEHVPAVIVSNNSYTYTPVKSYKLSYSKISEIIEKYISNNNPNLQNVNNSAIYIDYYYTGICNTCIDLKENVIKKLENNLTENSSLFFCYKQISDYNWEYQNCVEKYSTAYPFLVFKDFINETILTENQITIENIRSILKDDFGVNLAENFQNNTHNSTNGKDKPRGGFFLPGFESIYVLFALIISLTIFKKSKKQGK